jgi:regulator of cell morphogenesis and NO signaling
MSLKETTDAIVAVHHSFLRRELPRISELLESLAADNQSLHEAQQLYTKVRNKIEAHLRDEETQLFPTGVAIEEGLPPPLSSFDLHERLLEMEKEHENCGKALGTLEQMLHAQPASTLRQSTLTALQALRADLDVHVDKENSLVHPRLFELLHGRDVTVAK